MAYKSLSDQNQPVYTPLTQEPSPVSSGIPSSDKLQYMPLSDKFKMAGGPQGAISATVSPTPIAPPVGPTFGEKVVGTTKTVGNKVYDVATGLFLPTATPEETKSGKFLFDVAKSVPGAVHDEIKQVVTHPFTSAQDFVGGLARGIANSVTDIMINAVPQKDREATRTEVQATLDKYLTPPSAGKETPGGFLAGGAEIGGASAPFVAGGAAGGALGARVGGSIGAGIGNVGGFVGVGQATLPPEATAQQRLDQALNDVLALGIFKVTGIAYNKARAIADKTIAKAPEILTKAKEAYSKLSPEEQQSGIIKNPTAEPTYTSLVDTKGLPAPHEITTTEITKPLPFRETPKIVTDILTQKEGEAPGAWTNPEVGVTDLIYGRPTVGKTKGYGLAKIETDHPDVLPHIEEAYKTAKIVEKLPGRDILQSEGDHPIRFIVDHNLGKEPKTFLNNAYFVTKPVLRTGIEPVTQGVSDLRSTTELPKQPSIPSVAKGVGGVKQASVDNSIIIKHEATLKDIYKSKGQSDVLPEFTKADEELANISAEMDLAKAGQRIFVPAEIGGGSDVHAVSSTFPGWVPEHLRSRELFDKVMKGVRLVKDIKYPEGNRPKQRELYNAILDRLDNNLGVDTSKERSAILEQYGKQRPAEENGGRITGGIRPGASTEKPSVSRGGVEAFTAKDLKNPTSEAVTKKINEVVKQSEIAKEIAKKFDTEIRQGKFRQKALGLYKNQPQIIRYKEGGLNTIFHEVFHHLNERFAFAKHIDDVEREALLVEYGKPPKEITRRQSEAFSEFGRYYLTGQYAKLGEIAPNFLERFKAEMDTMPDIKNVLDTAATDYKRWQEQPATAKVFSQISVGAEGKGPLKDRLVNSAHDLYTQAIDDLHPLAEYSKIAREVSPGLKAAQDPYILARNMRGWIGRADTFLRRGTFSGKDFYKVVDGKTVPNYTGKSFEEIMRPIEEKGQMDSLRTYLVAKRAIELSNRKIKTGITKEDAKTALDELKKENPHFDAVAKDLYDYQNALLKYVHDSGLIDKATYEKMKELNQDYVPFYRVFEEMKIAGFMGGKKIGSTKSPVKTIRGSEREIIDPLESIVKNTYAFINAADRNAVAVAMARLSNTDYRLGRLVEPIPQAMQAVKVNVDEVMKKALGPMYDFATESTGFRGFGDQVVNIFRPSFATRPGEISAMMDGKYKVFQVETDLYRAIQGLDKEDVATFVKILSYPASWLRAGATLTPEFALRNPMRDQFSAFVYSKAGYLPVIDLARGMFELFNKGDAYQLWKMSGGESATLVSIDRIGLQKNLKEVLRNKGETTLHYVKNPIDLLREISNVTEVATRLGEMKKVLKKTGDPTEAAFASREVTLDFNRIGAKTKAINLLTAFWNANVQGTDKFIRQIKAKPRETTAKTVMAITLPSILLYFANRDDPRWKEIPQWQKDIFWIVFTENHIWRIPKPFEVGVIFGSIPERILEYIDNQDPAIFNELMKTVGSGATPGFLPTGSIPIIENIFNHSFFLDRPIVPQGKQGLPPEFQSASYTSEAAKAVGEAFNYSPAKIDNLIHGYTGGLGVYATQMIDSLLVNSGVRYKPPQPAKTLEDVPAIKAFLVRNPEGSGSESVNRFYNAYSESQAGMTYVKKMVDSDPEKAKKYLQDHPDIIYATELSTVAQIFSELSKARQIILDSKTLSSTEKKKRLDKIDHSMTEIAAKTMETISKNRPQNE